MNNRYLGSVLFLIFFGAFSNPFTANAQSNIYRMHSLFMYNFTKHVEWSEIGDTFTVGVYGSANALREVRASFAGKRFNGNDIRVINVAGLGDIKVSQIVYMPKSNKGKILDMYEQSDKANTLFVSEDDLIEDGFPISFVIRNSKLGFKVSRKNLEVSGLKVSSSLLSLAQEVVD
jgi:hypothetical protein